MGGFFGGTILRTTDGGLTWSSQTSGTTQPLFAVFCIDGDVACAVGDSGTILRTTNGGGTWVSQTSNATGRFYDVHFIDANTGTAVGAGIVRTTDGGSTWYTQNGWGRSVHFTSRNVGTVVGDNGRIFRTSTGGDVGWSLRTSNTTKHLRCVAMWNETYAVAVGDTGTSVWTTDGGMSWTFRPIGIDLTLRGVDMVSSTEAYAVGDAGAIAHTTNSGVTWNVVTVGTVSLNAVQFVNPLVGTIVGNSNVILGTTDGGVTWIPQSSGLNRNWYGMHFIDPNMGWVVGGFLLGASPAIIHTTDGGQSWVSQFNEVTTRRFNGVSFIDMLRGIAVGNVSYRIRRTTDGGTTWMTPVVPQGISELHGVAFPDHAVAYAVGDLYNPPSRLILRTSDGGQTWYAQQIPSYGVLRSIAFIDANRGIAVGDSGAIITTTTGGEVLSVDEPVQVPLPQAYRLRQNYPNPFNPSTTIEFELPRASHVTLRVFNILGQHIATLVDELRSAGTHTLAWDAGSLPSGVYLYRLSARGPGIRPDGNYTETKKMILVR